MSQSVNIYTYIHTYILNLLSFNHVCLFHINLLLIISSPLLYRNGELEIKATYLGKSIFLWVCDGEGLEYIQGEENCQVIG